jgi:hypothetical protein
MAKSKIVTATVSEDGQTIILTRFGVERRELSAASMYDDAELLQRTIMEMLRSPEPEKSGFSVEVEIVQSHTCTINGVEHTVVDEASVKTPKVGG